MPTAVFPPTWTVIPVPASAAGITVPRRWFTRSSVLRSCGAVFG